MLILCMNAWLVSGDTLEMSYSTDGLSQTLTCLQPVTEIAEPLLVKHQLLDVWEMIFGVIC